MTRGSKLLLYVVIGGPLVFLGLFLFALGPIGWAAAAVIGLAILASDTSGGDDEAPERTNCSACGAPNDPDRETCAHCGDAP